MYSSLEIEKPVFVTESKRFIVALPKDLALAIKMKAVQESRSYSDIVVEGMTEFMAKDKKK